MKKYDEEYIGLETLLPKEVVEFLHVNDPVKQDSVESFDYVLDEHELAMVA